MNILSEEKDTFLYKLLKYAFVYRASQYLTHKKNTYKFIYQNIVKTDQESIVLDCGCGPAQYRELIKCTKYVGIDFNEKYINKAIKKFPKDDFFVSDIVNFDFKRTEKFSQILLFGLLHHLNDQNAKKLINILKNQLKEDGKIITFDPLYVFDKKDTYTKLANFFASKDRGNYVRTEEEYKKLIDLNLSEVETKIYEKLLRIPWIHYVMYIKNK